MESKDENPAKPTIASRKAVLKRLMELCKPEAGHITVGLLALAVNAATNLSFPWILGKAVDFAKDARSGERGSNNIYAKTAGIFLVGSLASWIRVYYLGTATDSIAVRLRRLVFDECIDMEVEMFDATTTGELVSVLEKDVKMAAQAFTDKLSSGLRSINSAINGSVLLYCTSPRLTAVSMTVVPLVGIGAMTLAKFTRKLSTKLRVYEGELMNFVLERFSIMSTVRLNSRENTEKESYRRRMDQCFALSRSSNFGQGAFMSFINLSTNISLMAVLYVGGNLVATGEMTAGSLTRFAMQSAFVGLGFSGLSTFYSDMVNAVDAAKRVFDIVDTHKNKGQDENTSLNNQICEVQGTESNSDHPYLLELRDVRFQYADSNVKGRGSNRGQYEVLTGVSFTASPGGITAICGKSGCGKSTLVGVIAGLYHPNTGQVTITRSSGTNNTTPSTVIATRQPSLLTLVGVVEQSAGLFSGTIAENIGYGASAALSGGETTSSKDIECAARLASAHTFIQDFADGYDTQVGERGQALSGGQRMRVALARSLLKDPVCLLLDEATAALDKDNEAEIIRTLLTLSQGGSSSHNSGSSGAKHDKNTGNGTKASSNTTTNGSGGSDALTNNDGSDDGTKLTNRPPKIVVVVTHSIYFFEAMLRAASVVHVMEGGRIVESGKYADLKRIG